MDQRVDWVYNQRGDITALNVFFVARLAKWPYVWYQCLDIGVVLWAWPQSGLAWITGILRCCMQMRALCRHICEMIATSIPPTGPPTKEQILRAMCVRYKVGLIARVHSPSPESSANHHTPRSPYHPLDLGRPCYYLHLPDRRPGPWLHNEAACGGGHPARPQLSLRLQAGALR